MNLDRNKVYATLLTLLTVATAAVLYTPLSIIRPFKSQSEDGIALAYQILRHGSLLALVALALGVLLFILLWRRQPSWRLRVPMALLVLALGGLAFFSRINMFEKMFAPMTEAGFVRVAEADHLTDDDMVMGVEIGSQSKAYPVGIMTYHHILNDELGGVPLVVTY